MKKFFRILISLILVFNFYQLINAKPLPPGSGEGDVPANILILLDSSISMNNKIGDGLPNVYSSTIDGDGNRVISSADKNEGGLYLLNSSGERINFNGTRDNGDTYETRVWGPSGRDNTCDWRIRDGSVGTNRFTSNNRMLGTVKYMAGVTVAGTNINNENLLFVSQNQPNNSNTAFIALDSQYRCRLAITPTVSKSKGYQIRSFDISQNANGEMIFAGHGKIGKNAFQISCNFARGRCEQVSGRGKGRTTQWGRLYDGTSLRLNSNSTMMYIADDNNLYGYTTRIVSGHPVIGNSSMHTRFCNGSSRNTGDDVLGIQKFDIDPNDDNAFYVGGLGDRFQKVEFTSNSACTATVTVGTESFSENVGDPGTIAGDDINVTGQVSTVDVSGSAGQERIIFAHSGYVDELLDSRFVAANKDTAWQIQYGGTRLSRLEGAKRAILAVLSDTTLTTGANFGYGHWNSGERGLSKRTKPRGGSWCHDNNTRCSYYGGWRGTHPNGTSTVCTRNSCLNVGIGPEGANKAIPIVARQGTDFGTDSEAFSQIAHDYFFGPVSPHDPNSDCQLNYVIVIGDGRQTSTGTASDNFKGRTAGRLDRLRTELGVKSLMVAYGDGISAAGMESFDQLAIHGSCDTAGASDCEATIVARTPVELQTALQQKIRQILAERLAFTAPSITATIQQGGSLYQAQFAYEQFGEWKGTILRKTLNADGTVEHDPDSPGNWDAAERVRLQSVGTAGDYHDADTRNIWTAIDDPEGTYIGDQSLFPWDNVNDITAPMLEEDMERLGYAITNYYTSSSQCGGTDDTGKEERDGLLRFLAGQDFFDYNGNCDRTEVREHVLGDIYHSQLVEIGAPDGNVQFTDNNQEAYFRTINNYQGFKSQHANRRNILYAGSNSGLLHAFNAETGDEEWAFLPPLLIGKLPNIINKALDRGVDSQTKGGSNAIFGVDGSPVVHDVFMKGLDTAGIPETTPSWHTILFVPFGRGGSGFSVLDVTNPLIEDGIGPLHMFTVYNDYINNVVYITDHEGTVREESYSSGSVSLANSLEGQKALDNLNAAIELDGDEGETNQDNIAVCQTNGDVSVDFITNGTSSCFRGQTFTFNQLVFDTPNNQAIDSDLLNVTQMVDGSYVPIRFTEAKMVNGQLEITFPGVRTINHGGSPNEIRTSDEIFVQTSCTVASGIDPDFDYSKLGETWSTPRIVRLPSDIPGESDDPVNDKYVAIMGAGMSNNNLCAGSAVYLVELDDIENPGKLYGGAANGGPVTIVDTSPNGAIIGADVIETPNGSDISNAVPTSPLVITPDTAFGIPWRGAMVYINDREGKITKINLTDSTVNGAKLFDQTTLFRLNANTTNRRYTFFSMDAGIGVTSKDFWLFGGTGDFSKLGDNGQFMDNILYGVRDFDYPYFNHLNNVVIPSFGDATFTAAAHQGANNARSIDDATDCSDVTGDTDGSSCPEAESAWVIHLDDLSSGMQHTFKKASAPPTLFKGKVYFPVYEPPPGSNRCNIGNAYICVADDECGTNDSHKLSKGASPNGRDCTFVREGVLSELVIFGDKLFANVAGPSENPETLYSILAVPGEVLSNRGGWRDTGF
ncbi:MAG: pilus assembly protein PilY [Euryarchaeota archaeon]|nr:pilus assembly protein PilY [Euryarchaeota archaeon]